VGHRRGRRRLLRHQRLPGHRAHREPALTAGPARHPVLDGPRRAPPALRDRRRRRVGQLLRGGGRPPDLAARRHRGRGPRGRPGRLLPGLAPRRHRDDQSGREPHPLGAVHGAPPAALVPRPGRHPRRRRPRHAPAPRPGREHLDRGRLRTRRAARRRPARGPGTGVLPYQALRRARTRTIQRSSWVTNSLLHLPDGPAARMRNAKMARFPEDFGWIHGYDVQQALQASAPASR
jgi:hypothetical protein